mgnify:CR=1 FL=1
MYIKALTIHGFKSFRDATVVDSLSPHANVVVGRNGSGKSNFFAAIRFVLSDAYTSLSREERQALLYDASGATSATLSAFVEVVFDNADGRFPLNGDEVVVRRTVSLAKDEYMIDRKNASKTEVVNLLESAGFSRSNPYYIVPQGRITHLTNATDAERLALLKEVAGTRVYEQRRVDSVDILRATDARYNGTAELLSEIEARIEELEEHNQGRWADPYARNAEMRRAFRADKKARLERAARDADLRERIGWSDDLPLVGESSTDPGLSTPVVRRAFHEARAERPRSARASPAFSRTRRAPQLSAAGRRLAGQLLAPGHAKR